MLAYRPVAYLCTTKFKKYWLKVLGVALGETLDVTECRGGELRNKGNYRTLIYKTESLGTCLWVCLSPKNF